MTTAHTNAARAPSGSTQESNGAGNRMRPPLLASIGTVLIDSFESCLQPKHDVPPVPPPREPSSIPMGTTTTAIEARPQSPSRPSTGSSSSSAACRPLIAASGRSTPQRNFDSPAASSVGDVREVLGGGGMYALVGARMWLQASDLRCVVDRSPKERGSDFPRELEQQLNVFGEEVWCWNEGPETKATRARLRYEEDGTRLFEFIEPPPHRDVASLSNTAVFGSKYLHISPPYTSEDLDIVLQDLVTVRDSQGEAWRPTIVYEPHPKTCEPSHRAALEEITPRIDVLSPNHEELLAIYGQASSSETETVADLVEPLIRRLVNDIGVGRDGEGAVVVRCGRHGSCVGTRKGGIKWFPAFFAPEDADRVVDVSGAGNSYLGGYAAGLHLSGGDPYQAALYGTVSASFMVEQVGLPVFDVVKGSWNDDIPQRRLSVLRERIGLSDPTKEP